MVFEQSEIEDAVMAHFGTAFEGKRVPIHPIGEPVDQVELALADLTNMLSSTSPQFREDEFEAKVCSPYTLTELNQILDSLPSGKAAGVDNLSNELIRNSNFKSRLYLQSFLNRIISDGAVPPQLNLGKCVLIYKVIINY